MPSRFSISVLALALLFAAKAMTPVAANELSTLFTTPEERQLIDANRYKTDEPKPQPVEVEVEESPIQILVREEISASYRISGISLSTDGRHTAWINSRAYQDGETLEDGSRLRIIDGGEVRVRITAPDGKHFYGKSGETVELTYMAAVTN